MSKHIVMRGSNALCTHCGKLEEIKLPITPKEFEERRKQIEALHKDCTNTYIPPTAPMDKDWNTRALWWIINGETGLSSKTIWSAMMGVECQRQYLPSDPDDFRRCYILLQVVQEWKPRLSELNKLGKGFENLSTNWDKLSDMLINTQGTEMYHFMKELGL